MSFAKFPERRMRGRRPESAHTGKARQVRDQWPDRPYLPPGIDDPSGEKCRCGLRKPCNNCTRPIEEVAVSNAGWGGIGPGGNGWISSRGNR